MTRTALIAFSGLILAGSAHAGGWFILTLGQPGAHSDPAARAAAFTVRVYGCLARSTAVAATAEGLVNGERRTIRLAPVRLGGGLDDVVFQPGGQFIAEWPHYTVAIPNDLPAEGSWVVKVEVRSDWGSIKSALVVLGPRGVDRARSVEKDQFRESEVLAFLR